MRLRPAGRDFPGGSFLLSVLDRFPQVIRLDWDAASRELLATLVLRGGCAEREERQAETLLRELLQAYTGLTGDRTGAVFLAGIDRTGYRVLTLRWEEALPDDGAVGLLVAGLLDGFGDRFLWEERSGEPVGGFREEEVDPVAPPDSRLVAYREGGRARIRVG